MKRACNGCGKKKKTGKAERWASVCRRFSALARRRGSVCRSERARKGQRRKGAMARRSAEKDKEAWCLRLTEKLGFLRQKLGFLRGEIRVSQRKRKRE
jgi:hypothetical protein